MTDFAADTDRILFRPGILNFGHLSRTKNKSVGGESLAEKFGRVASFYAAYGPADTERMDVLLSECAAKGLGKSWPEVAAIPVDGELLKAPDELGEDEQLNCGTLFSSLVSNYRDAFLADRENIHSRIDDEVGMELRALVSTSVLTGQSADEWKKSQEDYFAKKPYDFKPDFETVKFGYWGRKSDLERIGENPRGFTDRKTKKFLSLGEATWREALAFSPAEPGLSRALEIKEGFVSAGGWSDLQPTLVLKNMDCQNVIYITRKGPETQFAINVGKMTGMKQQEAKELFGTRNSSFNDSIAAADAVWCTDWNQFGATELAGIFQDAFSAVVRTRAAFFNSGNYPNVDGDLAEIGCSPQD